MKKYKKMEFKTSRNRINVLALLYLLLGFFGLYWCILQAQGALLGDDIIGFMATFAILVSAIAISCAVIVAAYGLYMLKGWGKTLALSIAVIGLLMGTSSMELTGQFGIIMGSIGIGTLLFLLPDLTYNKSPKRKSLSSTIVTLIFVFLGLSGLVIAPLFLLEEFSKRVIGSYTSTVDFTASLLIQSGIILIVALGLWNLKKWSKYSAVILSSLWMLFGLPHLVLFSYFYKEVNDYVYPVSVLISALILICLFLSRKK